MSNPYYQQHNISISWMSDTPSFNPDVFPLQYDYRRPQDVVVKMEAEWISNDPQGQSGTIVETRQLELDKQYFLTSSKRVQLMSSGLKEISRNCRAAVITIERVTVPQEIKFRPGQVINAKDLNDMFTDIWQKQAEQDGKCASHTHD